uniref:Glutamine--fructose-6-phosphate aminotransferase [isomerizing] n=1 Tax=Cyanidium caldarium TaxID=2771 RepID=GLMS_CYACA|nr:L-glutamine-D-fructose-6-phosphate [Cyanidium caldarium]O19908.3 RecName: Full=Glutamine--fructose-6-phosphate aminotransferase [isomerizing]; AltName: Full=D-fructose-6-phosphate amidotransferase; AltName: Full=GFAT; AltName: Full=Glucosamine-6-phosphate synthase; AltName: Full=Hexosephosphate aminotransferase; AltName: Full=L-glutamine--D-fructose-6-phosphate amidotransferase [Cyanidium caldarium]AAB82681.1 unknown [Cyanidium caldarium]WDB00207.1 L-glutamine-D-fructose-6-phosphate [Cyanidiu
MCGIIGYVGEGSCRDVLINGLDKLSYRGYDSAGIAFIKNSKINVVRSKGRIEKLKEKINDNFQKFEIGNIGIGHTRWATHGEPTEINAHPHLDAEGQFAVVQNGVIENYVQLKNYLTVNGTYFLSDTDAEVIPHLIAYKQKHLKLQIVEAILCALSELKGNFSTVIIARDMPDSIFVYQNKTALTLGKGSNFYSVSSDPIALIPYTKNFIQLHDRELGIISISQLAIYNKGKFTYPSRRFKANLNDLITNKASFDSYTLKEIHDQKKVLRNLIISTLQSEKSIDESGQLHLEYKKIKNFQIIACGSSFNAALVGKVILEKLIRIPVHVYYGSEFKTNLPPLLPCTLTIAVSQSGETGDMLSAIEIEKSRRKFQNTVYKPYLLSITNKNYSSITKKTAQSIDLKAGIEIGVAATKTFTAQTLSFYLLALKLAEHKFTLRKKEINKHLDEIRNLPKAIAHLLIKDESSIKWLSKQLKEISKCFYIGKGLNLGSALEGALKLKEISYIHCDGYAAGEIKHGPIALVENNTLIITITDPEQSQESTFASSQEAKARGAVLLAITHIEDSSIYQTFDFIIKIPKISQICASITSSVSLQLFAYYMAYYKGNDIDKPRNLAKSVTVE